MVRVLNLITSLDRGGAETMIMNYYRHLDRDKVQFDFLVNRDQTGAYEEEIKDLGGRIYRMGPMYPTKFHKYKKDFRTFLRNHHGYTIIHSHLEERSYFPLRIAKEEGVPIRIAHAHNEYRGFDAKTIFRDYFRFRLPLYPTHKFACSLDAGRWLFGEREIKQGKVIIIPNAIDSSQYSYSVDKRREMRTQLGFGEDALVIGNVGRLVPQKNQAFLIDAFKETIRVRPNSYLLIVGEGIEKGTLLDKAASFGLQDRLLLVGSVSNVQDYLQAMDVFVFPSLFEGLGMSLIEAQSMGLPSIASDRVPKDSDITGSVKFLSLEESPSTWAKEIIRLSGSNRHSDSAVLLKSHGYDINTEANKLQDFYLSNSQKCAI